MSDGRPPLPKLSMPQRPTRPPRMRTPTVIPTGPKLYRQTNVQKIPLGGPGFPPAGFVTQQQSGSEWPVYWGSMRILDPERDPRKGPFYGGQNWSYQNQELNQYLGAHSKALSTNIDFIYYLSNPPLAVRIQSYRYHLATTSFKQGYDRAQLNRELGSFDEIEVYEENYIEDETGQAVIVLIKNFLGLVRTQDPLTAGTTQVSRNPFSL